MITITFSYLVIDGLLHHKNSEASRHISLSVHIFICSENTKNTKKLQQTTDFFKEKYQWEISTIKSSSSPDSDLSEAALKSAPSII